MKTTKENILDHPEDFEIAEFGAGKFNYSVSLNDAVLIIRHDFSKKDLLKQFIPALYFFGGAAILVLVVLLFVGFERDTSFLLFGILGFIFGLVVVGWIVPRTFFAMIKKVKWEFSPAELIITNFSGRVKSYAREDVSTVLTDVHTVTTILEVESTYWITLRVPEHVYENGLFYLLTIGGEKRKSTTHDWRGIIAPATGDAVRLAEMIAGHWKIPLEHLAASAEEE